MSIDGYTTIHRTTDLAQGELLAEMLRREGIDARFHKVSSTLIGLPASMIEMSVDVPAESEARARQLIADLEYAGAAEALDREEGGGAADRDPGDARAAGVAASTGADPDASRLPPLSRRRPIFAAAFALFLPGGAHLYARQGWTALVMATGVVACLAVIVTTHMALVFEFACAILAAIVACDALAGVRAARAEARGERRPRGPQIARGLVLLGLAIAVGGGGRFATAAPRIFRVLEVAKYKVTCTDREIFVENGSDRPRAVKISKIQVAAGPPTARSEFYEVGPREPIMLDLEPGARGRATPAVAEWLARSCGFAVPPEPKAADRVYKDLDIATALQVRPMSCRFWFLFDVRERGVNDGKKLDAYGVCRPPADPGAEAAGQLMLPIPRND